MTGPIFHLPRFLRLASLRINSVFGTLTSLRASWSNALNPLGFFALLTILVIPSSHKLPEPMRICKRIAGERLTSMPLCLLHCHNFRAPFVVNRNAPSFRMIIRVGRTVTPWTKSGHLLNPHKSGVPNTCQLTVCQPFSDDLREGLCCDSLPITRPQLPNISARQPEAFGYFFLRGHSSQGKNGVDYILPDLCFSVPIPTGHRAVSPLVGDILQVGCPPQVVGPIVAAGKGPILKLANNLVVVRLAPGPEVGNLPFARVAIFGVGPWAESSVKNGFHGSVFCSVTGQAPQAS